MIPNIKSSEGIGDGVRRKSYTCGLRVYHVQRASGTQYVPVQIISQRVSNCLDSVTERNNRIINGELASDLYIIKGTEFSGSGFNADYYDLNWLSNDNVQIVYVITIHLQR
jgi:hypothetical protein